jgi:hypothetical protein
VEIVRGKSAFRRRCVPWSRHSYVSVPECTDAGFARHFQDKFGDAHDDRWALEVLTIYNCPSAIVASRVSPLTSTARLCSTGRSNRRGLERSSLRTRGEPLPRQEAAKMLDTRLARIVRASVVISVCCADHVA